MDAQGKARSFPDPAAVLVKVQDLSVEERAVILFRHAKAAGMATEAKRLVRTYATDIVLMLSSLLNECGASSMKAFPAWSGI